MNSANTSDSSIPLSDNGLSMLEPAGGPIFLPSNKGKNKLCFVDGYKFRQDKVNGDTIYWKCAR